MENDLQAMFRVGQVRRGASQLHRYRYLPQWIDQALFRGRDQVSRGTFDQKTRIRDSSCNA
ncbi:unnamed protein product [Trichogramma brassicae]|uniref:Uncharacterized protein n=1 Tax=Trichogramma brassicae TaxID=86971 RepID=A0A6H5IPA4_9HYME|nr:unnamed protein product [Trichogramma brassicae]